MKRYRQYQIAAELSESGEQMVLATDYDALLAVLRRCVAALRSNVAEWTADGEMTCSMTCVKEARAVLSAAREFTEEAKP